MFVVDISVGRDPAGLLTFINPEFIDRDGMQLEDEGCLSVPGFNATVVRPSRVVMKGLDRSGVGSSARGHRTAGASLPARNGSPRRMVFVDRLRGLKRDLIVRRIKKLTRTGKW